MKKYKQIDRCRTELIEIINNSTNPYATLLFIILCMAASFSKDRYEVWDVLMRMFPIYEKKKRNWKREEIEIMKNIKAFSDNFIDQKNLSKIDDCISVFKNFIHLKEKEFEVRKTVAEFLMSLVVSFNNVNIQNAVHYMIYATNPEKYMES